MRATRPGPHRRSVARSALVTLLALLLLLTCVGADPASARSSRRALKTKVVKLLRPVRRGVRRLPGRVAPESRRRSRSQARIALRAARHRRFCKVATAVALIDHVGRVGRRLARVERLLRRSRVLKRCRDRGHRGGRIRVNRADGGLPGSGVRRRQPHENDQGEGEIKPLPIGPDRPRTGGRGKPTNTEGDATAASPRPLPRGFSALNDPVGVFRRTSLGTPSTSLSPIDPSSATAGDVVLVSGNSYLAVSTDGGRTFTYKNPVDIYSTSDPASLKNPDGGAGVDQVLHYDAATDRFYWLMQYWCTVQKDCRKRPGENRLRLAVASPKDVAESGGTRWRFWDLTSRDFGLKGDWLDFPDLAVGRKYLYLTVNSPSANTAFWARFRKSGLRDGLLDWWYHTYAGETTLKPVQNTHRTGYAVRRSSTSELELKRWPETTTTTYANKIPIGTVPTQDCSATSPDGQDFLAFQGCGGPTALISGAAMEGAGPGDGHIWAAWTSGKREEGTKNKDGSDKLDGVKQFPQAHVELAILTRSTLVDQQSIWNPDYAYSYPYLAGGPSGEIAMTYLAGGGKQYPGWGIGYLTNRRSFARIANGSVGATRVGDYLAVRPAWPSRKLFAATGNVLDAAGFAPYYTLFGRSGDRPRVLQPPVVITPRPPRVFRPDLSISAFTATSATIRNAGIVDAGPFFVTVSYVDANFQARADTFDVGALAAGASTTVRFDCQPGARTATADARGQVAEADEADNTATATFTCPVP